MAKRSSKTRNTLLCTLVLVGCVSLPWLLPTTGCEFDSSPVIERHPPVTDDNDSGDQK